MDMGVLNPVNKEIFNKLIDATAISFCEELPCEVTILLPDEYDHRIDGCIAHVMPVSKEERLQYIHTYVDELDSFGDDLMGHSLDQIFSGCITNPEKLVISKAQAATPELIGIYTNIWLRAFDKEMEVAKADILMDADKHFGEVLYDNAYEEYYGYYEPETEREEE